MKKFFQRTFWVIWCICVGYLVISLFFKKPTYLTLISLSLAFLSIAIILIGNLYGMYKCSVKYHELLSIINNFENDYHKLNKLYFSHNYDDVERVKDNLKDRKELIISAGKLFLTLDLIKKHLSKSRKVFLNDYITRVENLKL